MVYLRQKKKEIRSEITELTNDRWLCKKRCNMMYVTRDKNSGD